MRHVPVLRIVALVGLVAAIAGCGRPWPYSHANADNQLAVLEQEWTPLFDGTDLAGWRPVPHDPGPGSAGVWMVRDGALRCEAGVPGYLTTEICPSSYELEFEWRFDPTRRADDAGILVCVQDPDEIWPTCVRIALGPGEAGDLWTMGHATVSESASDAGEGRDGRRLRRPGRAVDLPTGEWNTGRISLRTGHLSVWINGEAVNGAWGCSPAVGRIALQCTGAPVEFRKLRIRRYRYE